MEPSGRNRWQPVANGTPRKRLEQADRQPVATQGNGSGAHGKEGVDGSSPSEGSAKAPYVGASRVGVAERFTVQGRAAWSFLDCSADLPQVLAERVRRIVGTAGQVLIKRCLRTQCLAGRDP
jgi:hypothetical protein